VWVYIRTLDEYPLEKLGREATPNETQI